VDVGHAALLVLHAVDEGLDSPEAMPLHHVLDDLLELLVENSDDGHRLVDELLIGEEDVFDLRPLRVSRPGEEAKRMEGWSQAQSQVGTKLMEGELTGAVARSRG
jgi:hypothetical protein